MSFHFRFGDRKYSKEHIDNNTLEIFKTGLQLTFKISKHILPCVLIFGCKIFVINLILGGLNG